MIAAPMTEQRDVLVALGWAAVSDYGYQHASGWTIGICRVHDAWIVELWDGRRRHAEFNTPLDAAAHHYQLIREDSDAGRRLEECDDVIA
ncbi:hypothetical protein [Burkholderia alba]|uniref:hypothetical protein n=1 Tax=Burkholderia alba TaxID=2683677 RepID=UPI002B061537|nr:hypothetical protein [Burkholderia alba]